MNYRKLIIVALFTLFFCPLIQSQDKETYFNFVKKIWKDGSYAPLIAYNYSYRNSSIELGLAKGWRCKVNDKKRSCSDEIGAPMPYYYISASSEFLIDHQKKFWVCPKVSHHITFIILDVGLSAIVCTNFQKMHVGLRPEIGITGIGVISFTYGYNFITKNDVLGQHIFSARIILGTFKPPRKLKHFFSAPF